MKIRNFSQPFCTAFHPKIFEGQVCYTINLDKMDPQLKFNSGIDNGLELLLDFNDERSVGSIYSSTTKGIFNIFKQKHFLMRINL